LPELRIIQIVESSTSSLIETVLNGLEWTLRSKFVGIKKSIRHQFSGFEEYTCMMPYDFELRALSLMSNSCLGS